MNAEKARGRSHSKSRGLSTIAVDSPEGVSVRQSTTTEAHSVNVNTRRHARQSASGILFALALAAGFYGSAYLAGFIFARPFLHVATLIVGACLAVVSLRRERLL